MPIFDRPLPLALTILQELAADLHWSWSHGSDQLWQRINMEVWEHTHNPISVLQLTSDAQLERLAGDERFIQDLQAVVEARRKYLTQLNWYERNYLDQPDQSSSSDHLTRAGQPNKLLGGIAYFSMEFGLCDALPLYAGGLGILAGDYLKTASDLGVPLVGVGLLYQEGYFRQSLNSDGWQQETYLFNDPGSLPLQPLRAENGSWLHIDTEFLYRRVRFRVWHVTVGRITLYLLDSNDPRNQTRDRGITSKLYGGSTELRLVQEIALGICGWRLIETLGLDIDVCHLNEGHAAFATLERIRSYSQRHKVDFWQALWATRGGNVFTTHTPVFAGFDRYPINLLRQYIGEFAEHLGISMDELVALGRATPSEPQHLQQVDSEEDFNMAYLAMNTCAYSNGVSRLHSEVSRRIFQPLFPRWPEREVPIGYVTNGVHVPTWDSPDADTEWTNIYGKERWRGDLNILTPKAIAQLNDTRLWQLVCRGRARLVDYARQRLASQQRHECTLVHCNLPPVPLDPNILTLGFARRFAEYKRPELLLHDPERLARLLCNSRYPVQLIVAGKAHPADNPGKQALQHWYQFVQRQDVSCHAVLIEDYDIALAQQLVQGTDIWINTPRRPWEASGTSGMKVLVNGGLNLSTLDGWWAEAYRPDVGWAFGSGGDSGDAEDAEQLYQLLENEVVPAFYKRDKQGLPREWLRRIRASMATLTVQFSSNRMIKEYLDNYYLPAAASLRARRASGGALATDLRNWHDHLQQHWHEIHLGDLELARITGDWQAEITVYLGGLNATSVAVEVIADPVNQHPAVRTRLSLVHAVEGAIQTYRYRGMLPGDRQPQEFTPRVISAHPAAMVPAENPLIYWAAQR